MDTTNIENWLEKNGYKCLYYYQNNSIWKGEKKTVVLHFNIGIKLIFDNGLYTKKALKVLLTKTPY